MKKEVTIKPTILKVDRDEYVKFVEDTLHERLKVGTLESEADFIAGAMVVFFSAKKQTTLPGSWVFLPMTGSIIKKEVA